MNQLRFNQNYNNKLSCRAFTTLRLFDDTRFKRGATFDILLKDKVLGRAIVVDTHSLNLYQMTQGMAMLDTGYSKEQTIGMLQNIYQGKDWTIQRMHWVLLRYLRN